MLGPLGEEVKKMKLLFRVCKGGKMARLGKDAASAAIMTSTWMYLHWH